METKHTTAALTTQDLERERERQYCELCGKLENLLKCGRCRNSFYCSKAHQTQHWKTHKLICKESVAKSQVSKETPAERQAPSGDWEKGQTLPQQKTCAASRSGETIMKGFITNAESAVSSVDKPGWSNNHTKPNGQTTTRSTTQKLAREYIVPCMTKHGICVVDNFLGGETGLAILEDVKVLHKTVKFTDGQLVSQKSDSIKDIRGDKITWIEGRESGCEKIRFLMSHMDDLARHCNGQLGNFTINVRTKGLRYLLGTQGLRDLLGTQDLRDLLGTKDLGDLLGTQDLRDLLDPSGPVYPVDPSGPVYPVDLSSLGVPSRSLRPCVPSRSLRALCTQ
nr:egl nine homolog 1-like [Salvelinus alpinus]